MQILNQLETEPIPLEEEERRHTRRLLLGILCALILTGSVFGGYIYLRKRHERQIAASEAAAAQSNRKAPPKVEVLVDDALTNGGKSVLVARDSDERLSRALHGLTRAIIANMVVGVTQGYEKKLEVVGVGYVVTLQGDTVKVATGYAGGTGTVGAVYRWAGADNTSTNLGTQNYATSANWTRVLPVISQIGAGTVWQLVDGTDVYVITKVTTISGTTFQVDPASGLW